MAFSRSSLFLLSIALLWTTSTQADTSTVQNFELPKARCENTQTGKYYVTDSHGVLCPRASIDSLTGCCSKGETHSCESCGKDRCCRSYENCVSCCLSPDNNASEKYLKAYRIRGRPDTGRWDNPFSYCQGICRTWGHSTVHENAFIDRRHYCYSAFGRPFIDEGIVPKLPEGLKAVPGKSGVNCEDTCRSISGNCDVDGFDSLNSCNVMREQFICEAGCGENKHYRSEPYYIVEETEKKNLPAYCAISRGNGSHDCFWKEANARRLCPCSVPT